MKDSDQWILSMIAIVLILSFMGIILYYSSGNIKGIRHNRGSGTRTWIYTGDCISGDRNCGNIVGSPKQRCCDADKMCCPIIEEDDDGNKFCSGKQSCQIMDPEVLVSEVCPSCPGKMKPSKTIN